MFNYSAEQVFVVQPVNAGGGIVAFLLSLDSHTATLNFKDAPVKDKLEHWRLHVAREYTNSHVFDFCNLSSENHTANIEHADHCQRYVHKNHFFELDALNDEKQHHFLSQVTGSKKSIGIYLTDTCIEKLLAIRPVTPMIDCYQKWIYSNQKKLLQDFYGITTVHHFPFSDLLDTDTFVDHLRYCKNELDLDIDIDLSNNIILQWYQLISFKK